MSVKKLVIAVFVATLVLLAGCGSPESPDDGTDGEASPGEGATPGEEAINETATENDQGANPVNPPNNTTGTASLPEANETTDSENDTSADVLAVA